jgi:hypothetical protein
MVICRARYSPRAFYLGLRREDARGAEEERSGRGRAEGEVERPVRAHCYAGWDGRAGDVVGGAGVEFLGGC